MFYFYTALAADRLEMMTPFLLTTAHYYYRGLALEGGGRSRRRYSRLAGCRPSRPARTTGRNGQSTEKLTEY